MLPKASSIENTLEAVRSICGRLAGASAVLAEPDTDLRRILGEALAGGGCSVRGAEDGEEALEAILRGATSIATLDLVMPRYDAISTIARIRADESLPDLPVLVLVPPELTPYDVERLQGAALRVARGAMTSPRPLLELLLGAVEPMSQAGTAA